MDILRMFEAGALTLVSDQMDYTKRHAEAGFAKPDWDLLTQPEYWNADQARQVSSILAEACSISLRLAGIPAVPLPGQYVAALICKLVAPSNRLTAALRAPRTFEAESASGVSGPVAVQETSPEQMMSLVMYFSNALTADLPENGVDPRVVEAVLSEVERGKKKETIRS